ncbi:MAG: ABC transporter permease subunit [Candidatus Dormibacteraeota bacterium]|nr:ABC transporter permease subunit [Candidatus Dormibacteraeota bacterium]MBO0761170.1 ABC transporter permease subunit [Candidatus Dormibacteraeota bacterium]
MSELSRLRLPLTLRPPVARANVRRAWIAGYLLCLPALLVVLGLLVYPVLANLWLSLTDASGFLARGNFVGLANYAELLRQTTYWEAARNTLVLIVGTAAVEFVIGLGTAFLLWWRFWGRSIVFLAVFIPWAFPSSFSGYAWYWLLLPPFNSFYTDQAIKAKFWLNGIFGDGANQVFSISVMNVWRGSSIIAIFLLAGFNAIPEELLDYGRLEARNRWRYLMRVVLPLNRRMAVLSVAVALTITYLDFVAIYPASGGRITVPFIGTLAYQTMFIAGQTGMASALIVTQFPVAILLGFIALRYVERDRRSRVPSGDRWVAAGRPAPASSTRTDRRLPRPTPHWRRLAGRRALQAGGLAAALVVFAFHLFPIYYTAVQAVRPLKEFPLGQVFWAYHPDLSPIVDAFDDPVLWEWTRNTFVIFGAVLVVGLLVSIAAGYALARLSPPGARWLARLLFCTYFVPQLAIILPLYRIYHVSGLDDTLVGLFLVYLTLVIPFSTWLFYSWFLGMDLEVEEHALLDASRHAVFFRVLLPMSWPVIIAAALFGVGMIGSDLMYSSLFSLTDATKTLGAGLGISAIDLDEWSNVNAAILLASLPQIIACAALGRWYVRGLRAALLEGA